MVGSRDLVVTFNWTKTIQFVERKLLVPVVSIPDSILCPIRAFKYMCQLVPAQNSSPAFVCPSSSGLAPVTYHQYQRFIRQMMKKINLEPNSFSSHSFRCGGATWAFSSHVPGELVRVHGDWKSEAYLKYLDLSLEHRLQVAQVMVQALPF